MKTLNFTRHPETDALAAVLRSVNGEISYIDASKRVGVSVRRVKQLLGSARRILVKEKIIFGTISNYGLRRLGDGEKVVKSENDKKKIGRASVRALRSLETIQEPEKLSLAQQSAASINRTIFALTARSSRARRPKSEKPNRPSSVSFAPVAAQIIGGGKP